MAFDALEMSLVVLEQLAPVEAKLKQRRKSLADEVSRAAESVALNISEGRQRAGLDRADMFRRAAGSASELTTALRIAKARGYISAAEHGAVEAARSRARNALAPHAVSARDLREVPPLRDLNFHVKDRSGQSSTWKLSCAAINA